MRSATPSTGRIRPRDTPVTAPGGVFRRHKTVADESLCKVVSRAAAPRSTEPGHLYTVPRGAIHNSFQLYTIRAGVRGAERSTPVASKNARRSRRTNGGPERRAGPGSSEYRAPVSELHPASPSARAAWVETRSGAFDGSAPFSGAQRPGLIEASFRSSSYMRVVAREAGLTGGCFVRERRRVVSFRAHEPCRMPTAPHA